MSKTITISSELAKEIKRLTNNKLSESFKRYLCKFGITNPNSLSPTNLILSIINLIATFFLKENTEPLSDIEEGLITKFKTEFKDLFTKVDNSEFFDKEVDSDSNSDSEESSSQLADSVVYYKFKGCIEIQKEAPKGSVCHKDRLSNLIRYIERESLSRTLQQASNIDVKRELLARLRDKLVSNKEPKEIAAALLEILATPRRGFVYTAKPGRTHSIDFLVTALASEEFKSLQPLFFDSEGNSPKAMHEQIQHKIGRLDATVVLGAAIAQIKDIQNKHHNFFNDLNAASKGLNDCVSKDDIVQTIQNIKCFLTTPRTKKLFNYRDSWLPSFFCLCGDSEGKKIFKSLENIIEFVYPMLANCVAEDEQVRTMPAPLSR